ncbi:MAG: selenocysteine-specific translation elongation factor [candidate division Zixibacteria bacterium]|nr:selenocysteine-specific translation elongation factor [candidate division Zixibacteria bacterium]
MIIIGTAGHIDHGKSSIVKRLTGTDPDRLPEEKARGMTIDLGFAFYSTSHGDDIAFVDVPGHERFVKNMIAGAGGIDVVMLVIAADDGWMPQSQEHFQIIRLLGIEQGIIIINKIDLAQNEWIDLLEKEVREKTAGSPLANVPIFRVSAATGEGFDPLIKFLNNLPAMIKQKDDIGKARLAIDRSFIQTGIGGVVTGTLRGGTLTQGQMVTVWPSGESGKIRSLQSMGYDADRVTPGTRVAVSLGGIDKVNLTRGGGVSDRADLSYFKENPVLALHMEMTVDALLELEDRRRALLLIGTSESKGEVRIFDAEALKPGESGIIFFRPDEPMYTLVGDHFILRLATPMITLGGGQVLDHFSVFPRRKELENLSYLKSRADFTTQSLILSELEKSIMTPETNFLENANISSNAIKLDIENLLVGGMIGRFGEHLFYYPTVAEIGKKLIEQMANIFKAQPHLRGIAPEALAKHISLSSSNVSVLMDYLVGSGSLVKVIDGYDIAGRTVTLKGIIKEAYETVMKELHAHPYAPPDISTFASKGKIYQQAIKHIIDSCEGYKCGSEFVFLFPVWQEVVSFVKDKLNTSTKLAVADLRDRFGFTRKYAIPILEETDRIQLTHREGDFRMKGNKFNDENPSL